jgi:hypothetical protein
MKERFERLKPKVSARVAIAAVLGAVGLAAAGTALAADKGGDAEGGSGDQQTMPAPAPPVGGPMMGFAPGGPPMGSHAGPGFAIGFAGPGAIGKDGSEDFAQELADHLDGVSTEEIADALQEIGDEHEADRRAAMAAELAKHLDGVSADDIAAALQTAEDKMRAALEDGDVPEPGLFTETLADALGLSEDEVTKALQASAPEPPDLPQPPSP